MKAGRIQPPAMARPRFLGWVAGLLVAGNAVDLIGTRIGQPNFEIEANPVYRWLLAHGYQAGWPEAIVAKALVVLLLIWGSRAFLAKRREWYPDEPCTFGQLFVYITHGRYCSSWRLLWSPGNPARTLLIALAAVACTSWLYMAYLGYENVATWTAWPVGGGRWLGPLYIPYSMLAFIPLGLAWFGWQVLLDHRWWLTHPTTKPPAVTSTSSPGTGQNVSAKIARAARTDSSRTPGVEWISASRRTPADLAISAASGAPAWP